LESLQIIVGLGRSGVGAAKLLNSEGKKVFVIEKSKEQDCIKFKEELSELGIFVDFEKPLTLSSFKPWLGELSSVVISPSIPWDNETLNGLRKLGIKVHGEISLAWERLKHIPWVGITGTNGKTTVTHMLHHVLKSNKIHSDLGGNVGNSAAEIALKYKDSNQNLPKWLIMELSSYQIESSPSISPEIGIWTTLTPDHLDRHKSLNRYASIKRSLLEKSSVPIYNADDKYLNNERNILKTGIWISANYENENLFKEVDYCLNKEGFVIEKGKEIFHSSILSIPGIHNIRNLLMVTAAAREMGLKPYSIEKGLSSFKGVKHRLEYLGKYKSIEFFNDSKATNYDSASAGLQAINFPSIVIAGGKEKQGDPLDWLEQLNKKAYGIILYGSCASKFKNIIKSSGFKKEIYIHKNLRKATEHAIDLGLRERSITVILSPASASFDQYKSYEERGNHFKEILMPFLTPNENNKKI
tara:strand:+ start:6102 stop:7511 length:1410 start_codon:yes stop_codon:yes gene_type:complete